MPLLYSLQQVWQASYATALYKRIFRLIVTLLYVVSLTFTFFVGDAHATFAPGPVSSIPTVITQTSSGNLILPDWSNISFENLPVFSEGGFAQFPSDVIQQMGFDPSMTWQAGDRVADVVRLGTIQDFGLQSMNLNQVGELIGLPGQLSNLPINQFQPATFQDLSSLSEAVPQLADALPGQIRPIRDMIVQGLGGNLSLSPDTILGNLGIAELPLGQLLQQMPQLGMLRLDSLDLSQYAIAEIPNLDITQFGNLRQWQESIINGVPGLAQIDFSQFPNPLTEGPAPFIARVDVPLDSAEQDRERSLSGSFQEGFRVPCSEDCTHAELTPLGGSQMDVTDTGSFANGKAWISGKAQQVRGGYGPLAVLNGGMEPTGRNPYGGIFKQVIWNVDQAAGKVESTLWFRYCKHGIPDLGCTPYFLGPVPFIVYPEEMLIFLGDGNAKDDGRGISFDNNGDPLSAGDGFSYCGGKLTGTAVDNAIRTVDTVSRAMGGKDGAFSTNSRLASEHIPGILAALREQGITCPAQVAYVLATVHRETSFVNFEEGSTRHQSDSEGFWGRGYVQITHRDAYQRMGRALGVDLENNPDLARQPDVAARILAYGFKNGSFGVRRTIDEMIPCNGQVNYREARRMINDSAQAGNIAQAAQMYYDALTSTSEGLDKATVEGRCEDGEGEGGSGGNVPAGSLNERILQSINNNRGFRTAGIAGTNGGRSACAAAVNNVLSSAGIAPLGGSGRYGSLSVDGVENALRSGRGVRIDPSQAQPGDIVIARDSATRRHVGFCTSAGCQSQISNGSSSGSFSWNSRGYPPFKPSYRGNSVAVYRLRT